MGKDHAALLTTVGLSFIAATAAAWYTMIKHKRRQQLECLIATQRPPAYESLIGSTPLVRLERLSEIVGCSIWVKMESMNPGATGKDRAALGMIQHAEREGILPHPVLSSLSSLTLHQETPERKNDTNQNCTSSGNSDDKESDPMTQIILQAYKQSRSGGIVVEGTSGSTGIALATLSAARGHACLVVLPDDQASEKQAILKALGAVVYVVPTAAISNPQHYVNIARRLAEEAQTKYNIPAVFMNQFENAANFQEHYCVTGPEIWEQFHQSKRTLFGWNSLLPNRQRLDAFVMSAGTGGTISGIGKYLKEKSQDACRIVLVDPPGSSLYHKIKHGVAFAPQQREQSLRRHRYDTIAEGIGLDRVTHNLSLGLDFVDDAVQVSDQEALDMAHFLLHLEGLWVGSSSAMNVVGAIRTARDLDPNKNVITVICDSGSRHVTRMWNQDFVTQWGLQWPGVQSDGPDSGQRIPECLQGLVP